MGRSRFILLLPPSEGKAAGGEGRRGWTCESGLFGPALGHWRATLVDELERLKGGDSRLLGVGGEHLRRAREANSRLVGAPVMPAWRRYTGVVWDNLDPGTLPSSALERIWVVSGLAGLVSCVDPLPDYRLKMSARLPATGHLAPWWRDDLTDALVAALRGRTVVDLLPQEHRAALDWSRIDHVRIDLLTKSGGKAGGHFAKAAKGHLARELVARDRDDPAGVVGAFRHPDFVATLVD